MKSQAINYFFILVLCLFGLSTLKCDNTKTNGTSLVIAEVLDTSKDSKLNKQLVNQVSKKTATEDNSSDFTVRFPNIFDVFRSLF